MFIHVTRFKEKNIEDAVQIHEVHPSYGFVEIDLEGNKMLFFSPESKIETIELKKGDRYVIRAGEVLK